MRVRQLPSPQPGRAPTGTPSFPRGSHPDPRAGTPHPNRKAPPRSKALAASSPPWRPQPGRTGGEPSARRGSGLGLSVRGWSARFGSVPLREVSEPPGAPRRSRHWSLSIEERRQRAAQDAAGPSAQCPDVLQAVAQLVSDDVDKDVLAPHPAASAASARAFRAFLARAARAPRS